MRAELKRMHSPDVHDLAYYQPRGPFGILVQMMIGPEGIAGEEAFDTVVCSPDWLAEHAQSPDLVGDHQIVMEVYDYQELRRRVQDFCQPLEGNTWQELAAKLGELGAWEFASYVES
jgi:hypothetical protein